MSFEGKNSYEAKETYVNIIMSVAGSAASQVDGVASVSYEAGLAKNIKLGKHKKNNAIAVELYDDGTAIIDISVNLYYGTPMPRIIAALQEKIKTEVERATSYTVKAVNVIVAGVVYSNR